MKKDVRRVLSKVIGSTLATTMLISGVVPAGVAEDFSLPTLYNVEAANAGVVISESSGWLETAFVEWADVTNATSYAVYYKNSSSSSFTQIDDELIRRYAGYWRADAMGLSAGNYTLKVTAFNGSSEISSATTDVTVMAQDRSGFAFKGATTPGAYKADGTLKDGAQVIYVNNDNFATKQVTLKGKNGADTLCTGVDEILQTLAKSYNAPVAIRIIGKIDNDTVNSLALSSEKCIEIKGKESGYNKNDDTTEITIEGVGEDAFLGGGVCINKATYVELRNYAVGWFGDDGISMKEAQYAWVHNLELMYGHAGSDADQAKGDGSIDFKDDSQYLTISYNHFWDSGKASLCGMKSESGPNYVTYHHNWFDHSDSRHPRIRKMSVHIYNNFFDGNSKYGVGMTYGGSAFVENNVFNNCKNPMLISKQGTDAKGDGTFSGENGGVIKAFNNIIKGTNTVAPVYYSSSVPVEWDAYLATSRAETVPSNITAAAGGTGYDNTSLAISNLNATPESVDTVENTVKTYAGRIQGGDFDWTFTDADNTNYAVDTDLKAKIGTYMATENVISIGGSVDGSVVPTTEATTSAQGDVTEATTEVTTGVTEVTTEGSTETTTLDPNGAVSAGTYNLNSSTLSNKNCTAFNMTFALRSVESSGVKLRVDNTIKFTVSQNCTLAFDLSSNGVIITADSGTVNGTSSATVEVGGAAVSLTPGSYTVTGATSSNTVLTAMTFTNSGGTVETTTVTTETTTEATTVAPTTVATTVAPTTVATTIETTTEATTVVVTETTTESTTQDDSNVINSNYELTPANFDSDTYFTKTGDFSSNSSSRIRVNQNNSLTFTVAKGATVSVTGAHASSTDSNARSITLLNASGDVYTQVYQMGAGASTDVYATNMNGTYTLQANNHLNITSISITFPEPTVTKGDASGDGVVNITDVTAVMKYVLNKANTIDIEASDVSGDGKVTGYDAYLIRRFVLGYTSSL